MDWYTKLFSSNFLEVSSRYGYIKITQLLNYGTNI